MQNLANRLLIGCVIHPLAVGGKLTKPKRKPRKAFLRDSLHCENGCLFHLQVIAKNRVGETNMDTKLEVVTEEPGFITALKDCQTKLGNTETFECVVKGVPRPEVAWSRGDKELKKGKRLLFEEEEVEGGVKYKMTVADITQKDFGDVSCIVILPVQDVSYGRAPKMT